MRNYLLEENYFKLKAIGIYQIIGGLIGASLVIWVSTTLSSLPYDMIMLFTLYIGIFIYSIVCGIGLYLKKDSAINFSIFLNSLQIISFTLFTYSFKFISGVGLLITLNLKDHLVTRIELDTPVIRFTPYIDASEKVISINVAAIIIIIFLKNIQKSIYTAKQVER